MSEPENFVGKFLERWSRRKRAAAQAAAGAPPRQRENEAASGRAEQHRDPLPDPAAPPFDLASLPPIESINAASDVRAFLAPGVPIELTRAALRRAWTTDPSIRDFIGIAENQWDFTQSGGVPGFGELKVTEELRRIVSELGAETLAGGGRGADDSAARADQGPEKTPEMESAKFAATMRRQRTEEDAGAETVGSADNGNVAMQDKVVAAQDNSAGDNRTTPSSRKHGRALPK